MKPVVFPDLMTNPRGGGLVAANFATRIVELGEDCFGEYVGGRVGFVQRQPRDPVTAQMATPMVLGCRHG